MLSLTVHIATVKSSSKFDTVTARDIGIAVATAGFNMAEYKGTIADEKTDWLVLQLDVPDMNGVIEKLRMVKRGLASTAISVFTYIEGCQIRTKV